MDDVADILGGVREQHPDLISQLVGLTEQITTGVIRFGAIVDEATPKASGDRR